VNIATVNLNKWLYTMSNFGYPLTLTLCHMVRFVCHGGTPHHSTSLRCRRIGIVERMLRD